MKVHELPNTSAKQNWDLPNAVKATMELAIETNEPDVIIAHTYDTFEAGVKRGCTLACIGMVSAAVLIKIRNRVKEKKGDKHEY